MKIKNSIWLFLIISIAIFTILLLIGDVNSIKSNIQQFNWFYVLFAIGFFLLAIGIRVLRWHFWFHKIGPAVSFKSSMLFYMSGFAFTITPGRVGEAIRSYFIKRDYGVTQSKTVPLVLVERFYDLTGLIIITAFALIFVDFNKYILIIPISFLVGFFVITQNKNFIRRILSKISTIKFLSKFAPNAEESSDVLSQMLNFRNFTPSSLLGALIAILDVMGAFMILHGLHVEINFAKFILVISVSIVGGSLSFIPGGIGIQESGILGLLTLYKIQYSQALIFAILYRVTYTALFTIVGLVSLRKISGKINKT
jgi:uncharacterized protein (TIRG00374 family)